MLRTRKSSFIQVKQRLHISFFKSIFLVAIMLISLLLITYRLLDLQIFRQEAYQLKAESNIYRVTLQESPRGTIYDRNGIKLAEDISSYHLYIDPSAIKDLENFQSSLSQAVEIDQDRLSEILTKPSFGNQSFLLKSNLSKEEIARFQETLFQFDPSGRAAILSEGFKRSYPQGKLLSHAIGYTGIISEEELNHPNFKGFRQDDRVGKQGIERYYDSLLTGTKGRKLQRIDAFGRTLEEFIQKEAEKGTDLYLTIDVRLQKQIENLIQDHVGTCIIMDIHQGEILAFASFPDYNPNIFSREITENVWTDLLDKRAFFNIATQGSYAPGSTFKPLVALYALENQLTTRQELITCRGSLMVPGIEGKYNCTGVHGPLRMTEAIKVSCDVYFYELAKRFPIDSFLKFAKEFGGISQITGIDLPFENEGFLGSPQYKMDYNGYPWFEGDSMNLGIGQGFLSVTPMQLCNLYARLANGGVIIQPHFLKQVYHEIISSDLKKPKKEEKYSISYENIKHINLDLEAVVSAGGTAWALQSSKLKISAKTGTAEGIKTPQGETSWDLWLAAIAPAGNPQIVAVMMFENSSLEFGGNLAPLLKKAIETWYEYSVSDGGNHA